MYLGSESCLSPIPGNKEACTSHNRMTAVRAPLESSAAIPHTQEAWSLWADSHWSCLNAKEVLPQFAPMLALQLSWEHQHGHILPLGVSSHTSHSFQVKPWKPGHLGNYFLRFSNFPPNPQVCEWHTGDTWNLSGSTEHKYSLYLGQTYKSSDQGNSRENRDRRKRKTRQQFTEGSNGGFKRRWEEGVGPDQFGSESVSVSFQDPLYLWTQSPSLVPMSPHPASHLGVILSITVTSFSLSLSKSKVISAALFLGIHIQDNI